MKTNEVNSVVEKNYQNNESKPVEPPIVKLAFEFPVEAGYGDCGEASGNSPDGICYG